MQEDKRLKRFLVLQSFCPLFLLKRMGQFVLDTYAQVENLLDLLDERYTKSEITGEEYDTEVKQVAEPV